jgi:hypothetical protein
LQRTFLETVGALRERELTAMDVAIQARLSKTPEEYEASRARLREASYEALLAAGRKTWLVGERIRFYKAADGTAALLPDTSDELAGDTGEQEEADEDRVITAEAPPDNPIDRRDYDVSHYLQVLLTSYVGRLRKAFAPEDFDQLFRADAQLGLFDRPLETIQPLWIRCQEH